MEFPHKPICESEFRYDKVMIIWFNYLEKRNYPLTSLQVSENYRRSIGV